MASTSCRFSMTAGRRNGSSRLHTRRAALSGISVEIARRADLRAADLLARRVAAVARLEGDRASAGSSNAGSAADLERHLRELPCDEPGAQLRSENAHLPHDLDRDGRRV